MVGLTTVTCAKNLAKNVNPRDEAGNAEEEGITAVLSHGFGLLAFTHSESEKSTVFRSAISGHPFQAENWAQQALAHMYRKFKVGESEMCPCNADIMTAEHLLRHCQLQDALRRDM